MGCKRCSGCSYDGRRTADRNQSYSQGGRGSWFAGRYPPLHRHDGFKANLMENIKNVKIEKPIKLKGSSGVILLQAGGKDILKTRNLQLANETYTLHHINKQAL